VPRSCAASSSLQDPDVNDSTSTSLGASASRLIAVREPSGVGEARRQAAELGRLLAFESTAAGKLALGINEAGMNIVKHARDGLMLLRARHDEGEAAVEVLALDRGGGMTSVAEAMRDGYSTAGSAGTGLGALARLSPDLQIVSHAGKGTALRFAVHGQSTAPKAQSAIRIGAVCVPMAGEAACGDGWAIRQDGAVQTLLVVDGLGHGVAAAAAAHAAIDIALRQGAGLSASALIECLHAGMRATRGAAGAVVVLEPGRARGTMCGLGNIVVAVRNSGVTRRLVSHNGILGHQRRKVQEFGFDFPAGALVIAHSDGLDTRWRLEDYPGLENAHPALIAGVLYRDHERGRDDATVVVVRNELGTQQ
jgi:anti-sigma regulatory factor (Ser/Thr protein kinase)